MAENATLDTEFDDKIRAAESIRGDLDEEGTEATTTTPFFSEDITDYEVGILECADLTGDRVGEMVVGLSAGAAGRIFQWAIFTPDSSGQWTLAFDREMSLVSSIEIEGGSVIAQLPTYDRNDPLCCPSGSKTLKVGFHNGEFQVVAPRASAQERLIRIEDGRVARIGDLEPIDASPRDARDLFGIPTSVSNYPDTACQMTWSDIGLSISFANFGGADPCGEGGRIATVEIVGAPAEQAGWQTDRGAEIGSSVGTLERLYPESRRDGSELTLVEVASAIGAGGTMPIATAFIEDGVAGAYRFYVGAAGE